MSFPDEKSKGFNQNNSLEESKLPIPDETTDITYDKENCTNKNYIV